MQIFHPPETNITTLYKHAPTSCLNASIALTQVCNEHAKKVRRLTTVTIKWAVTLGCHFQHNNPTEEYAVSQRTSFGQRTYVTLDATSVTLTRQYRSVSAQHQCTALETLTHHSACTFPFCMQNNTPYHIFLHYRTCVTLDSTALARNRGNISMWVSKQDYAYGRLQAYLT